MADIPKPYTVSAITRMIKSRLEESFQGVWVEGEVSNYKLHTSGHRYFDLKDDNATIRCTVWRSQGTYLKFEPENGQKLLAFGDISVYEKQGSYQLNCRKLVPVGVGPLELAFRQLFERLSKEGLFDDERKKPLPLYPLRIGVVTSPTGAAVRDIMQIAQRRNHTVQLILYPAQVQGDGAEKTIAAGIAYFNSRNDIDLLIVGRGGGSMEDLWPFNTEITVRAIVGSRIPIISAVGHEIDTTLADYAADLRAPTPSAAAELAVWSRDEFQLTLKSIVADQTASLNALVRQARQDLTSLLRRPVYVRPMDFVNQRRQSLDMELRVLEAAGKNRFDQHKNRLSLVLARLESLSPLQVLARGYSVTRSYEDRRVIRSRGHVKEGDRLETIVEDGRIISRVEKTEE